MPDDKKDKPEKPIKDKDVGIEIDGKIIPPTCRLGYTADDLTVEIFKGDEELVERFKAWMIGQTYAYCEGRIYNFDTGKYEEACGGVSHGPVFYSHDVKRFLNGEPIVDW